jgi:HEAT repeat protein
MLAAHALAALLAAGDLWWPGALEAEAAAVSKLPVTQRLRAVEAMTARAGAAALPLLVPLLADSNIGVRQFAARRLARAGHPAVLEAATRWIVAPTVPLADRGLGLDVLREVPALTPAARQAVERALRDADGAVRVAALDTLERHEVAPSLAPVIAALDDDNREVRVRAVRLAGSTGDARVVLPLLGRLEDSDRQVRLEALRALGSHPRAAPALIRLAGEGPDDARGAAVEALGAARVEAALPNLVALARRRPQDDLGRRAQLALGKLATPAALASLVALLRSPPVSEETKAALTGAAAAAVPLLLRELDKGTPTSAAITAALLADVGDRRATAALAAVAERRPDLAPAALEALGRLADPAAVPKLARAAESADLETRRRAYAALLAIGDERATVVLDRGLVDPDPYVRVLTARLAGAFGPPNVAPAVAGLLADADREVRRAAAHALGGVGRAPAGAQAGARGSDVVAVMLDTLSKHGALERSADEWRHIADAFERLVDGRDAGRVAAAWRAARGPLHIALARAVAAAHAGRASDTAGLVRDLLASVEAGGAGARAAADALAGLHIPDDARPELARAFAASEAATRARLCPAIAQTGGGGVWLASLIQAPAEPPEVRAAAAWAARGNGDAHDALAAAAAGDGPIAANARAALAAASSPTPGAWTAARLAAPDGSDVVGRWVTITAAGGVVVWAKTDAEGALRVHGLPAGGSALRAADQSLRLAAAGP